jgi:hypothetical protein
VEAGKLGGGNSVLSTLLIGGEITSTTLLSIVAERVRVLPLVLRIFVGVLLLSNILILSFNVVVGEEHSVVEQEGLSKDMEN